MWEGISHYKVFIVDLFQQKTSNISLSQGKEYRLLSLFSGCGGMDLGFEGGFEVHSSSYPQGKNLEGSDWVYLPPTKFQTVFANDITPEAQTLWEHYFVNQNNHAQGIYQLGSIVDLVRQHRKDGSVFPSNIDIVTGGFPCQDFSLAGKRRGFASSRNHLGNIIEGETPSEETRGKLYMWMKEVIEITLPKIFIAENVKGLVSLDDVKEIIQKDFSTAGGGYIVLPPRVLHAAKYGVPQSRERVIFIGVHRSSLTPEALDALSSSEIPPKYDPYPQETHSLSGDSSLPSFVSVGSVLAELLEPESSDDWSQKYYSRAKFMGAHCQGQKEINPYGLAPTIRSEHHGNIEFRRLSADHGGQISDELKQGLLERRLTPRECAMIQTFPPNYAFVLPSQRRNAYLVSPSAAYRAIGNAVPPLLAYHIALRLEKVWSLYFA